MAVVTTAFTFDAVADRLGSASQVVRAAKLATDELAVVFPGFNYAAERPLLHFAAAVFRARGRDLLNVVYPDLRAEAFDSLPEDVQMDRFRAFARSVANGVLATGRYKRVALVGKSLGTVAVAEIASTGLFRDLRSECVLVTPLASEAVVADAAPSLPRTLVILGTDDPSSQGCDALFDGLANVELLSLPGGHSLEVDDDPAQSVVVLGQYVAALTRWLDAEPNR